MLLVILLCSSWPDAVLIGSCSNMEWKLWTLALSLALLKPQLYFYGLTKENGTLKIQDLIPHKYHSFTHGCLRLVFLFVYHKKSTHSSTQWRTGSPHFVQYQMWDKTA